MSLGANDALDPCLAPTKHPLAMSPSSGFTVLSQPSKGSDQGGGRGCPFSPHLTTERKTKPGRRSQGPGSKGKQGSRSPAPLLTVGFIIFHTGDAQASPAQPGVE